MIDAPELAKAPMAKQARQLSAEAVEDGSKSATLSRTWDRYGRTVAK